MKDVEVAGFFKTFKKNLQGKKYSRSFLSAISLLLKVWLILCRSIVWRGFRDACRSIVSWKKTDGDSHEGTI